MHRTGPNFRNRSGRDITRDPPVCLTISQEDDGMVETCLLDGANSNLVDGYEDLKRTQKLQLANFGAPLVMVVSSCNTHAFEFVLQSGGYCILPRL